jgi:hypothetical protein
MKQLMSIEWSDQTIQTTPRRSGQRLAFCMDALQEGYFDTRSLPTRQEKATAEDKDCDEGASATKCGFWTASWTIKVASSFRTSPPIRQPCPFCWAQVVPNLPRCLSGCIPSERHGSRRVCYGRANAVRDPSCQSEPSCPNHPHLRSVTAMSHRFHISHLGPSPELENGNRCLVPGSRMAPVFHRSLSCQSQPVVCTPPNGRLRRDPTHRVELFATD